MQSNSVDQCYDSDQQYIMKAVYAAAMGKASRVYLKDSLRRPWDEASYVDVCFHTKFKNKTRKGAYVEITIRIYTL